MRCFPRPRGEAARIQEGRLELLARAVHEAVWDWDLLTDRMWFGPGVCSLFGYFSGEVKPEIRWWQDRIHPEDRERVVATIQDSIQQGVYFWSQEYRFQCADGFYANVIDRGYVLTNDFGKPVHAIWATRDVSEFKTLEGKVRISERMASVGQLVAGVVHELNNPLGGILGFTQLCMKRLDGENPLRSLLESIEQEVRRCQALVQRLLGFSRNVGVNRSWVNLPDVVEHALTLVQLQAGVRNVEIKPEFDETLPAILADSSQIQQVVINLCVNALDAMVKGGTLTIIVDSGEKTAPPAPGAVRLRVIDQGSGIPLELRKHLFEAFVTTKEPGKGTGLGLSIVKDIVESHGGLIEIDSRPAGTTFTVWFPGDAHPLKKIPATRHPETPLTQAA